MSDFNLDTVIPPIEELNEEQRQGIRRAIDALPTNEGQIIRKRFGFEGEPWEISDIASELGYTKARVRQLEGQALARLTALRILGEEC